MSRCEDNSGRGPRIRILLGSTIALGPGKADLLEAIQNTGSIAAAARTMSMSYRRAWLLVDTMNGSFCSPLVVKSTGGNKGGGAQLTPLGQDILHRYRSMERKAHLAIANDIKAMQPLLHPSEDQV